ncbi:Response regulator receiver domain-containing protein [Desulfuromusa kysingii]|uniref:Response regulator receiver domain-containing protein n=1 Tax=Desulfuromusa kysingii TaxID=37625 RepID=A0A1H4C9G0_9BACT|nr:response regulator [Desulfuromusa kysingii]SEA57007.1 Response regulator receiver domain-containing protein [Desulfuromusa kysingii]
MIVAVDDEPIYLDLLAETLVAEGYEVKTFISAVPALEFVVHTDPQLIISDINMPKMDGFQFYQEYQHRFSHRQTPFVFLSSLTDPKTVIKGLNSGVDDYLQKPLHPQIIKAKVQSILKLRQKYISQLFSGNLEKLPFTKVLQFCELKKLTGWVDILADGYGTKINFAGGELQLDDSNEDYEKVFDLHSGHFTINVQQVDYHGLHTTSFDSSAGAEAMAVQQEKPMGKLSGIKIHKRLFQIQTESTDEQDPQIVSIVVLDGRVILKRSHKVSPSMDKREQEKIIEQQHQSVEEEVRGKLDDLLLKSTKPGLGGKMDFHQLYDAGYDQYCSGNYSEALKYWEKAENMNAADKTLAINLSVVRKKLSAKG